MFTSMGGCRESCLVHFDVTDVLSYSISIKNKLFGLSIKKQKQKKSIKLKLGKK